MSKLKGACIIGQSGGPTSVINASILGAMQAALASDCITRVLGASHGIKGVLNDDLIDINKEDPAELELLRYTPSSALGSCRYKLADPKIDNTEYKRILEIFKKYDVRYFFYNGGNDSMDTCNKISKFMIESGYECRVMGIPKTIDNDLFGTDHCPGYASSAKYIATSCMELYHDARVYDTSMVTVLEIMGRNAGWLAASSSLATYMGQGPDLIYLPEIDFDMEQFLKDVDSIYKQSGKCIIAVSEGIHDSKGIYISEYGSNLAKKKDCFGHSQMGGLASTLVNIIQQKLSITKVRGIEFSLLQRCASHCASQTDAKEAYACGKSAVENAIAGKTDCMTGFLCTRDKNGYQCEIQLMPLSEVANAEKKIPREWINEAGNGLNQQFIDYAMPLIIGENVGPKDNGLPRFAKLKMIKAKA